MGKKVRTKQIKENKFKILGDAIDFEVNMTTEAEYNGICDIISGFVATIPDFYCVNEYQHFGKISSMKALGPNHPKSGKWIGNGDHFHIMVGRKKSGGRNVFGLTNSSFIYKKGGENKEKVSEGGKGARINAAGNLCPCEGKEVQIARLENGELKFVGSTQNEVRIKPWNQLTYSDLSGFDAFSESRKPNLFEVIFGYDGPGSETTSQASYGGSTYGQGIGPKW